jgi:SAM-dependent methyltransferase
MKEKSGTLPPTTLYLHIDHSPNRFGESSVTNMRNWAQRNLPLPSTKPIRILECGSGNGTLLLSFLTSPSTSQPQAYHLTGIDYSPLSATLSRSIEQSRRQALAEEEDGDDEDDILNPVEVDWRTGDLLQDNFAERWDLVLDKGTYDALCLSDEVVTGDEEGRLPSLVYPERVAKLVEKGGWFLITSCNFTEEEIKRRFTREGLGEWTGQV